MHNNLIRWSVCYLALSAAGCSSSDNVVLEGAAGNPSTSPAGGKSATGGAASTSVNPTTGGKQSTPDGSTTGGKAATGGSVATGGKSSAPTGGAKPTGGAMGSGGVPSTGGAKSSPTGGAVATGGNATGGLNAGGGFVFATGGKTAATGGQATGGSTNAAVGGKTGTGGGSSAPSSSTGPTEINCSAAMPTGGTAHCGQNSRGTAGGLNWELWSNTLNSNACITTYSTTAFSASWNGNGDFLARIGLEMGNGSKSYTQYGTIKADFAYTKTGSAGGYSYIGIYGWTNNPCVEWYIVDDRWGTMPFNAYNATQKGTAKIDGADYKLFSNRTNGTGGSRCSGVSQWDQYWSIRQTARQCGTITISEHFKAWDAAGMSMKGGLLEAKILVETGGEKGSIQFPVANVTAQ